MNEPLVRLAITQSELFDGWPDEAIASLIKGSDVQVVEPGTRVIRSGDPVKYLYLIASGSISLSREMPSGRSFMAGLHFAGGFHGLGPVMGKRPHIYTAVCKERTVLVCIPASLLRNMVASNGRLSASLFVALESRFLQALDLHASAAVNSIQARIAGLLKSISARGASQCPSTEIHLLQDELATMLGTRRQVVNRALRAMEVAGAIHVQYGRISIVDREKLDHMALASP